AAALRQQLSQSSRALLGNADAEVFAFTEDGFSPAMVKVLEDLPEVASSAPVVSKRVVGTVGGQTETFDLLGIDPTAEQRLHPLTLSQGAMFGAGDKDAILVTERWASGQRVSGG